MKELSSQTTQTPAGGGAFHLPRLTLGVFLADQPAHRLSLGSDRPAHVPMTAKQGWILPGGAEGVCEFENEMALLTVEIGEALLEEQGIRLHAPHIGPIDPLVLHLAQASKGFSDGGPLYAQTMARALVAQLGQSLNTEPPVVQKIGDKRLKRTLAAIHDAPEVAHTLDSLAGLAGLSAFHFARAFRAATGQSPLQYVIQTRMEAAQVLLTTTRLPVAEIAWRVGYSDTSRFTRHFRQRMGKRPSDLRD